MLGPTPSALQVGPDGVVAYPHVVARIPDADADVEKARIRKKAIEGNSRTYHTTADTGPLGEKEEHLLLPGARLGGASGSSVLFKQCAPASLAGEGRASVAARTGEATESAHVDENLPVRIPVPPTSAAYIERAERRMHFEIDDIVRPRRGRDSRKDKRVDPQAGPHPDGVTPKDSDQSDGETLHAYYEPANDVEQMVIEGDE